ncbi:hypothetical protein Tco_1423413, partial [Tanacetum coccineum]
EDEEIEKSSDSDSESEDAEDEGPTAEDDDPATGDEGLAAGDEVPSMGVESLGLGGDEAVLEAFTLIIMQYEFLVLQLAERYKVKKRSYETKKSKDRTLRPALCRLAEGIAVRQKGLPLGRELDCIAARRKTLPPGRTVFLDYKCKTCTRPTTLEVNSRAKIQSHKTRNTNKPIDQKSHTQKPSRQIFTRNRFSPNKTSAVYEKTSHRSDLRWKPTGRIFKSVGLWWIPTSKLFDSYISKDDSEPTHDSNVDIPNIHESKQTLDLSACISNNVKPDNLRPRSTTSTEAPTTNIIELESLFSPLFDEYFNGENQVVSKSFAVTTADASDKRQQQPDSTSSTSTLATSVTADGNFD